MGGIGGGEDEGDGDGGDLADGEGEGGVAGADGVPGGRFCELAVHFGLVWWCAGMSLTPLGLYKAVCVINLA